MTPRIAGEGIGQIRTVRCMGRLIGGQFFLGRERKALGEIPEMIDLGRNLGRLEFGPIKRVLRDQGPEQRTKRFNLSLGDDLASWVSLSRHDSWEFGLSLEHRAAPDEEVPYLSWAAAEAEADAELDAGAAAAVVLALAGGGGAGLKNVTRQPPAAAMMMPR